MSDSDKHIDDASELVIGDHNYDGIQEFDNPMPAWWTWGFWIGIAFAPIYVLGITVFDFVDTYEEDLSQAQEEMALLVPVELEISDGIDYLTDEMLKTLSEDPVNLEEGNASFQKNCFACHGPQGQGTIGPNLTDNFWIHGDSTAALVEVINIGVLEKGMPPWEKVLPSKERAQLVLFIRSLKGTSPPNPKAPQGIDYSG